MFFYYACRAHTKRNINGESRKANSLSFLHSVKVNPLVLFLTIGDSKMKKYTLGRREPSCFGKSAKELAKEYIHASANEKKIILRHCIFMHERKGGRWTNLLRDILDGDFPRIIARSLDYGETKDLVYKFIKSNERKERNRKAKILYPPYGIWGRKKH